MASSAPRRTIHELHDLRDYLAKASTSSELTLPTRQSQCAEMSTYDDCHYSRARATTSLPVDEPVVMSSVPLARESVALLIDAVRASVVPHTNKIHFLFQLFDVNGTNLLSRDGVREFIEATLVASALQTYGSVHVDDIVDHLFEETEYADVMTYREFQRAFQGVVMDRPSTTFDTAGETPSRRDSVCCRLQMRYNQYAAETHWLVVYFAMLVGAFVLKAHYIADDPAVGYAVKLAKGSAQIVMVNTLLLLLPVCRHAVTFLRKFSAISSHVPLDHHIAFHKICGIVTLLASLVHCVTWGVIIYYLRTVPYDVWSQSQYAYLTCVREDSALSLLSRLPMWTGVLMALLAAIAAPFTHPSVRRGDFNAFWLTHLLFVPLLALLVVHGLAMWVQPPQAHFWVLPPLVLYLVGRRFRVQNVAGASNATKIQHVRFYKETVAIYMAKPRGFRYRPGMYAYLKVPLVSTFEWHPFTISSAPEADYISVHIRNAGDWTGALHAVLRQTLQRSERDHDVETGAPALPTISIDGPVGAPSQDYYRYESVVLIGVTPFASILQSIVHQWEAFRCDNCDHIALPTSFKLKKIHFYWLTREQEELTWFAETMNQLSAMDTDGRLEIHNYYSPLTRDSVIAPLHALQRLVHRSEGHDLISGLATKQMTHFGRPDWKRELERIAEQQQDTVNGKVKQRDVGVFVCGPKALSHQIHDECTVFNKDKQRNGANITYDFHSENF